jgi:flagellin-like hook-associated protein FlgL
MTSKQHEIDIIKDNVTNIANNINDNLKKINDRSTITESGAVFQAYTPLVSNYGVDSDTLNEAVIYYKKPKNNEEINVFKKHKNEEETFFKRDVLKYNYDEQKNVLDRIKNDLLQDPQRYKGKWSGITVAFGVNKTNNEARNESYNNVIKTIEETIKNIDSIKSKIGIMQKVYDDNYRLIDDDDIRKYNYEIQVKTIFEQLSDPVNTGGRRRNKSKKYQRKSKKSQKKSKRNQRGKSKKSQRR